MAYLFCDMMEYN